MAQVSTQFVHPDVLQKLQSLLVDCVNRCSSGKLAADFIEDLLTDTEKVMIAKRIGIALMLMKHIGVREISETLKVSFPTIYKVKTWMIVRGHGYRSLLESILKRDEESQREHQSALDDTQGSVFWFGKTNWREQRRKQWEKVRNTNVPF